MLYEQLSSKWWLLEVCLNHIWALKFDEVWSKPRKKIHQSLGFTSSYRTQVKCCHYHISHTHKKSRKFTSYTVSETEQSHLFPECVLSHPTGIQRGKKKVQGIVALWLSDDKPDGQSSFWAQDSWNKHKETFLLFFMISIRLFVFWNFWISSQSLVDLWHLWQETIQALAQVCSGDWEST